MLDLMDLSKVLGEKAEKHYLARTSPWHRVVGLDTIELALSVGDN